MDAAVGTALAALGGLSIGVGLVTWLAKLFISRALRDLDALSEKVCEISERVSAMLVRLETVKEIDSTVKEHSKKIAYLEAEETPLRRHV